MQEQRPVPMPAGRRKPAQHHYADSSIPSSSSKYVRSCTSIVVQRLSVYTSERCAAKVDLERASKHAAFPRPWPGRTRARSSSIVVVVVVDQLLAGRAAQRY